jgi:hypothetical protein
MQEMTFASPKAFAAGNDCSGRKCFSKVRQAQASIDRVMMMITKTIFCKGFSDRFGLSGLHGHFWACRGKPAVGKNLVLQYNS